MATKAPWLETRLPLGAAWRAAFTEYRTAREQPYIATLPGLILGTLIFLGVSGAVLSLFYVAAEGGAYASIQFIMRSVNFGWLIESFHATGATMLFASLYLLLFHTMLTRAYKGSADLVWFLKLKLLIIGLGTGWLGYVMTDGAVSSWSLHNAALAGARLNGLPGAVAEWVFGGPGPGTLARMAVFHVILALLLFAVIAALIAANRIATPRPGRSVAFHPYYTSQYFVAFVVFALVFAVLVFFAPHLGQNRLNLVAANPLVVPVMLNPPWYLLPAAAIGGALPGSLGCIAFIAALAVLYALPWLDRARPGLPAGLLQRLFVWVLALDVIALGVTAAAPPSALTGILTLVFVIWYFLHFLVITPLTTGVL